MKHFHYNGLLTEQVIENLRKLKGYSLFNIQCERITIKRKYLTIEGLCRLIFIHQEKKEKIGFIDFYSMNVQDSIWDNIDSLQSTCYFLPAHRILSKTGRISYSQPYPALNANIVNGKKFKDAAVTKILFYGINEKNSVEILEDYSAIMNIEHFDIKSIEKVVFFHANGESTIITASSFNRITVSPFKEQPVQFPLKDGYGRNTKIHFTIQ